MKFRRSAVVITIYFSFTLLIWMSLFINASEDKSTTNIIPDLNTDNVITQNLQRQDVAQPLANYTIKLLHLIRAHILSKILNEFLTIYDILTFRKTCKDFKILLQLQDDTNMVIFCKDFGSKEMDVVPLIWFDLKYFLNQSYTNALENMQMLNLKHSQYAACTCDKKIQYAVCTRDKKIISWYNDQQALDPYPKMIFDKITNEILIFDKITNPYPKMIFDKITNEILIFDKITNEISQLSLAYKQPKIWNKAGNAWAKITNEGNVITGGNERDGGNSTQVQSQFKNVKMIVTTINAFAALLGDGRVVVWGDGAGNFPESIQAQLHNTKMIFSNDFAFAALLSDGSVVAWGDEEAGGKIPELIQAQLKNVKMIFSSDVSFSALLEDKSVIQWGEECQITESIQTQLHQNVKMIFSNHDAFATLLSNGQVVVWGDEYSGGTIPERIKPQLQTVKMIFSIEFAFAALLHDGSVFAWGDAFQGGKIPDHIQIQLHQNVKMIFSNNFAFVALLKDRRFVAWGNENCGGKITVEIQTQLKDVQVIFSSSRAFAALLDDGSVFTWGDEDSGGTIPDEIQSKLIKNVKMIFPQKHGFKALCKNGEMISWCGLF